MHSNLICNTLNLKTAQMPFSGWTGCGVTDWKLVIKGAELLIHTVAWMDLNSIMLSDFLKRPNWKGYILSDFIDNTPQITKLFSHGERSVVVRDSEINIWGRVWLLKGVV